MSTSAYNGIPATELGGAAWRKSSASSSQGACVEFALLGDGSVAMRNSRFPDGPALIYTKAEIAAMLDGAPPASSTAWPADPRGRGSAAADPATGRIHAAVCVRGLMQAPGGGGKPEGSAAGTGRGPAAGATELSEAVPGTI